MGFWLRFRLTEAAFGFGSKQFNELKLIKKSPNDVFLSDFHIAYLWFLMKQGLVMDYRLDPNSRDLGVALAASVKRLLRKYYTADTCLLEEQAERSDQAQTEAGQAAASLYMRALLGDSVALEHIKIILPKRDAAFRRAAVQAGIDLSNLPQMFHSVAFLETLPTYR